MMDSLQVVGDVDAHGLRTVKDMLADPKSLVRSAKYFQQTDSTNTVGLECLRSGSLEDGSMPQLILADTQTAGRGRLGRTWQSDAGTLVFSLILRPHGFSGMLPLAVGIGVARSIEFEFAPRRLRLKWPNDVWIGQSKLAGVLCETAALGSDASSGVVIGVGMNVATTPDIPTNVSNLSFHVGRPIRRHDVLPGLVQSILETVRDLSVDASNIRAEFDRRCVLRGTTVQFTQQGELKTATCDGIDDEGRLVVRLTESPTQQQRLHSGEVHQLRLTR